MISLEQVNLLEVKVARAVEHVRRINEENASLASENSRLASENAALVSEKAGLLAKLETNQKRIDELEVHVMRFKEDQGRIEDGIIAALDRLNQFEEAFESSLKDEKADGKKISSKAREANKEVFFEIPAGETDSVNGKEAPASGELDIF